MSAYWARRFHELYEGLAPGFGYETRPDTKVFDPNSKNGRLMVRVCGVIVAEVEASARALALKEIGRDVLASVLLREFSSASAETWENTRETRREGFRHKADAIIRALAERPPAPAEQGE